MGINTLRICGNRRMDSGFEILDLVTQGKEVCKIVKNIGIIMTKNLR